MKHFLNVFFFLMLSLSTFAQEVKLSNFEQQIVDSLKTVLLDSKSDSLKALAHFKISNIYGKNHFKDISQMHFTKAVQLSKTNPYLKSLSIYYDVANLQVSAQAVKKWRLANNALKKYSNREVYAIRTKIVSNIALYHQRNNETLVAIKILIDEAIPLAKKANDNQELAFIYRLIGLIFYNDDELIQATNYVNLSIETLEKKNSKNIGYEKDLIETYLFYVEILSVQKQLKKADYYLSKANKRLEKNSIPTLNIEYYFAEGAILHEKKAYVKELDVYEKGSALANNINDEYALLRFELLKFEALKQLDRYSDAKNTLLSNLESPYMNIEDKASYFKELSTICKQLKDFPEALKYSEKFIQLNDSLNKISHKNQIAEIEARYKSKEKEHKISKLNIQKRTAELLAQNSTTKYLFFGITSLILLFAIVLILLYQKKRTELLRERDLKNKQRITMLKKQKEVEVMLAMIDGEELERKRIARELHDGIGSKLSALKIMLARMQGYSSNNDEISRVNELLNSSITELRQVAFNLIPESLLKLGLENALNDLCHLLHSEMVKIEFQSYGITTDIPVSTQINIYRIVQELINNALKHSECSEILVSCSQNQRTFLISVEDNGKGFEVEKINSHNGFGLKNVKSRIEILQGNFTVESNSKGTCYNIELNLM